MSNKNNFPPGFESDKANLAIDFDGVIHNMNKGFYDGTCYGDPIPGSLEAIEKLSKKYKIIVFSAKSKTDRPLVDGKTGTELIELWLKKNNILKYVSEITAEKPRAILYIDDNAVRFENWSDTIKFIDKL